VSLVLISSSDPISDSITVVNAAGYSLMAEDIIGGSRSSSTIIELIDFEFNYYKKIEI